MNSFIRFLPHAIITGILGGLMQFVDLSFPAYFCAWVGFAAWASYFIAGGNLLGGVKVVACWSLGMIAAVCIVKSGTWFTGVTGNAMIGFPVMVGIVTAVAICFQNVPFVNHIPFWFIGAACFFGLNNSHGGALDKSVPIWIISVLVAQVFGWATVTLRGIYTRKSGV